MTNSTQNPPPSVLFRLLHRLARAYVEQLAREDHARVMAQFLALDRTLGKTHMSIPDQADRLEQLWRLRAK